MPALPVTPYSFGVGSIQDRETIRVISQIDELVDTGEIVSNIMKWMSKSASWNSFSIDWTAIRLCIVTEPTMELFILGPFGELLVVSAVGPTDELLDESDEGPSGRGPLRDLKLIGAHLYAVGMSRQVYRREGPSKWIHQDVGTVLPLGSKIVAGFNSIDGLNESDEVDFYAVGFGGEIWRCLGGKWKQIASPTNVVLHRVKMVRQNLVYACGQGGVLLRGHGDQWEQIEHDATDDDLWDMEWYGDQLYLAKDDSLMVLTEEDDLESINFGLGGPVTCRHLHAKDGILLSTGPKHVLWTSDGKNWNDITP